MVTEPNNWFSNMLWLNNWPTFHWIWTHGSWVPICWFRRFSGWFRWFSWGLLNTSIANLFGDLLNTWIIPTMLIKWFYCFKSFHFRSKQWISTTIQTLTMQTTISFLNSLLIVLIIIKIFFRILWLFILLFLSELLTSSIRVKSFYFL